MLGGILFDHVGTQVASYARGVEVASNNVEKAYPLMRGLVLANELKVKSLIVWGDSMVVIKAMLGRSWSIHNKLAIVIGHASKEAKEIYKISFFHVKQELNAEVDQLAKRDTETPIGVLGKNGGRLCCNIP